MLRACWTLARIPRLLATHRLHLITGTATSAHGSCKPRVVRLRRNPHTRPPDTHQQFSPQYTTSTHALEVGAASLEYQGSLVNTYSSLVLRSMPNKQRNRHPPHSRPAVARPQDGLDRLGDNKLDEDDTRVSDDGARDTSMSSARGGFGGFGGGRHRDSRHSSPSPAARGAARGGFGSRNHNGDSSPSPAASGGAAHGFDTRARSDPDGVRAWKKGDFPTDEALRPCRVKRHEDLPRHIYLLLDILGLQLRWLLTRMGIDRTLVSSEELAVDDHKERPWMALYANDRDVIEDLLYRRLRTLWSGCTDAIAIFSQHSAQEEFWYGTLSSLRSRSTISACRLSCLLANLAASWPGMATPRLTSIATSAMSATLCKR